MALGLSTRYVRTGPMHPRNQVSAAEMFSRLNGAVLPTNVLLALCAEHGIDDAHIELGQVVASDHNPRWGGDVVVETALQVERLAAARVRCAA